MTTIRRRTSSLISGVLALGLLTTVGHGAPQSWFGYGPGLDASHSWFGYGPLVERNWDVGPHSANPEWVSITPKRADEGERRSRVLVLYPRPSSAYDVAITKILEVFEAKDLDPELTVINFQLESALARQALAFAEASRFDLIFAMGSESTAWMVENYQGPAKIPVVSVCAKDPVQLGQMRDYLSGSGTNIAFTSLNVPVDVQMAYVRELSPALRNLTVLVDSKNVSAVQTQGEPIAAHARKVGVQVIWGAVKDPVNARAELAEIVRDSVARMRKSDPELTRSLFWLTGSTSVFAQIKTINENADRVPIVSVVPEIVKEGPDSAVMSIGVSFESNAQLAAIYGAKVLTGASRAGDLPVGLVSPPDLAVSFLKAREIGLRVPFNFFETASFVYDYEGKPVRTIASKMSAN